MDSDRRFRVPKDGESGTYLTSGSLKLMLMLGGLLSTSALGLKEGGCIW